MVRRDVPACEAFGELRGIAADLNGDALDSGCHLRNHLLAGMKKAHLHEADRLKEKMLLAVYQSHPFSIQYIYQ